MKVRIKPHIAFSETGMVFNPESGETFMVNPVGIELLQHFSKLRSSEEAQALMLNRFHVDAITLENDCNEFIEGLKLYHLADTEK